MNDANATPDSVLALLATWPRREFVGVVREAIRTIATHESAAWDSFRDSDVGHQVAAVATPSEREQLLRLNAQLSRAWFDLRAALRVAESAAPFTDGHEDIMSAVRKWRALLDDAAWYREQLTRRAQEGCDNRDLLRLYSPPGSSTDIVDERDASGRIKKITRLSRASA